MVVDPGNELAALPPTADASNPFGVYGAGVVVLWCRWLPAKPCGGGTPGGAPNCPAEPDVGTVVPFCCDPGANDPAPSPVCDGVDDGWDPGLRLGDDAHACEGGFNFILKVF